MKSLLIADDELSIREGLKYILDWEEIGFSLCGEAGNGEEALQKITTLNPDLVLLDVRMPKMMGTEVLRRARAAGFTGKCIILSGYSDFGYAQEAITNGVSFYITKPLDEDELYECVCKIKESLELEARKSSNLVTLRSKAKEVILREYTYGLPTEPLSAQDLELLHLEYDSFQIVISTSFRKEIAVPYSLTDLLKVSRRENNCFEHFVDNGMEVIVLKGQHGQSRLSDILEHFDEEPELGSPLSTLFITYGRPVEQFSDIHTSYLDAKRLLDRLFFCPMEQHYMGYEELPSTAFLSDQFPQNDQLKMYAEQIAGYIQAFNHKQMADSLQSIKNYLSETTENIASIKMFLADLYFQVKENIIRAYPSVDIPFPPASTVIRSIDDAGYLYEIIRYLSEQCNHMMEATGNPNRDSILDDILYYIDHNYASNIKLDTIAPLFGYNSAYLGKIFHKNTGESFNSYIDHKRIDASKALLENQNLKVYEISEMVGYKNVDYFHKKFRKYVGLSPAEYRKTM